MMRRHADRCRPLPDAACRWTRRLARVNPTDIRKLETLDQDEASVELLRRLRQAGYRFVTPARRTLIEGRLRRILRPGDPLRDVFGWNKVFRARDIDPAIFEWMKWSGFLHRLPFGLFRSKIRVASLGHDLIAHSPLFAGEDAVFFGPDTYRFTRFLEDAGSFLPAGGRVVDLGTGTGAAAIAVATMRRDLTLAAVDINREAVRLARINLAAASVQADVVQGDGLGAVEGHIDAVIANPPFLAGSLRGTYRNGGADRGSAVTLDWVRRSAARLGPRGTILLYGASAIVDGRDELGETLERELRLTGFTVHYRELDPDIFAGMLWRPTYRGVDRIAAVTMIATRLG